MNRASRNKTCLSHLHLVWGQVNEVSHLGEEVGVHPTNSRGSQTAMKHGRFASEVQPGNPVEAEKL